MLKNKIKIQLISTNFYKFLSISILKFIEICFAKFIEICCFGLIFGFWILCFAQEQFVYDAKGKRDPFIPLVTADGRLLKLESQEDLAELSLEGIIYDKNGISYAIVNGEIVKIGDRVSDYQVLKIEPQKVIFIKEGQPQEVELKKETEE